MKARTIKNAIEAHGWVGVIVSVALFTVFWAGAVTLFYPEVSSWAKLPLRSFDPAPADAPSLREVIEERRASVNIDPKASMFVRMPGEHSPFFEVNLPLDGPNANGEQRERHFVSSKTGRVVATDDPYQFPDFLYQLHYDLKLPQGLYIVGLITLFFAVLVMTGVVIQLKQMFEHFFLYRHEKGRRMRAHDLHSVAGVVTLPFAALYALTGLMFNLRVLFLAPVVILAYGGDQKALFADAGIVNRTVEPAGLERQMPELEPILARVEKKYNAHVTGFSAMAYGDENAILRIVAEPDAHTDNVDVFYEVKSDSFPEEMNIEVDNVLASTVFSLFELHMGRFGGVGIRFLFFALALAVCGMIIAGNILWLIKRESRRDDYPRSFAVVRGLTLGGCTGVVVATCGALVLERLLPGDWASRVSLVNGGFFGLLAAITAVGFFIKSVPKFLARCAWTSTGLLAALVSIDVFFYGPQLTSLWAAGEISPGAVTIGFAMAGSAFAWIARTIDRVPAKTGEEDGRLPEPNPA
ncbi:MAG: PepSY-associated TM helix domain-containing protein [Myxococcota bacterium]